MKKKDCNLVIDLLPSYIDKLTSDESNKFVEKHLAECEECQQIYKNMLSQFHSKDCSNETKQIDFFKKIKNKINFLQAIIIIIVLVFMAVFLKKNIIINNIENKAGKINYNNYSKVMIESTEKYILKTEYYQNDNNFLTISTKLNTDGITKTISYNFNGKSEIKIFENGVEDNNINNKNVEKDVQYQFLNKSILGNIGLSLKPGSIKSIKLYNNNCYLLDIDNYLNFIDKKTGLTIKEINLNNNSVIDYTYTFGDVTDEKLLSIINNK